MLTIQKLNRVSLSLKQGRLYLEGEQFLPHSFDIGIVFHYQYCLTVWSTPVADACMCSAFVEFPIGRLLQSKIVCPTQFEIYSSCFIRGSSVQQSAI